MTKDEMTTTRSQMGGYLKVLSYQDAWAEGWKTASKEFKAWVLGLPNFNAEIFYKITGIKIDDKKTKLLRKADELIAKANQIKEEAEKL